MGTLVAIDSQNLYYSARRVREGSRVDFQKLWDRIHAQEPQALCIVYLIRGDFDSSGFENLLRGVGFRISPRNTKRVRDGSRTRLRYDSHDIRISLDASFKYNDRYDKFVLVSGDVDFSDLFSHLEKQGKKTEFWSFDRTLCPDVMETVGKVVFMDEEFLQDG
jgi:uncharacterized LabA/DUF88 family protein